MAEKLPEIELAAKILGRKGGEATLKKFGAAKMRLWGKRGGRPKSKKTR